MATVADVDLQGWTVQSSSPIRDGNFPNITRGAPSPSSYTPSADSRLVYVDPTLGNDGTGAFTDIATQTDAFDPQGTVNAYQTISAAVSQLRDGEPDWLLLKRGESFSLTGSLPGNDGRSSSEPALFTYYGTTGERPELRAETSRVVTVSNGIINNVVYYGLYCHSNLSNPNDVDYDSGFEGRSGMLFLGGGDSITIDDCKFDCFDDHISIQGFGGNNHTNVVVKNSIFLESYDTTDNGSQPERSSSAFFDQVNGLTMDNNFFDRGGWHPDIAWATKNVFNHNVYIQYTCSNVVFTNNISTRSSNLGAHVRSGGLVENNLFIENIQALQVGWQEGGAAASDIETSIVQDNVVLNGVQYLQTDPLTSTAVWGIRLNTTFLESGGTFTVQDNIVADAIDDLTNSALFPDPLANTTFTNNIVWNWRGTNPVDDTDPGWVDPSRSIADFAVSEGIGTTTEDYINYMRNKPFKADYTSFEAPAVNAYIRAGYTV